MTQAASLLDGETIQRFASMTRRAADGEISPTEFRAFRVPNGVYEERKDGSFMLRVRLVAGRMSADQARALAKVARRHGSALLHVTSRQDIQLHAVPLEGIYRALLGLAEAGLSTKGGGGNSVRNVAACAAAGVCPKETFDVTPWVAALTERLLADPLSLQLPRKYKIAFSGCDEDCAAATVQDLGLVARVPAGEPGFAVYVGGGMGAHSRLGQLLEEFVPAEETFLVAEGVKRVFDRHGNRRDRHRARLRFLVEQMGLEAFRDAYHIELDRLRANSLPPLVPTDLDPPERADTAAGDVAGDEGRGSWFRRNTDRQRQDGYRLVHVPLRLGDVTAEQLEGLAHLAEEHGDGLLRATPAQNLSVHWVPEADLPLVWTVLQSLGLGEPVPAVIRSAVSCTGSSTCRLGICLSRGLSSALVSALESSRLDLDALGDLRVQVSGCPNSCGRHPVADIGLFGGARRVDGRLLPHYTVQLGGRVGVGRSRLAEGRDALPARNVPSFLVAFLQAYVDSGLDFEAFLSRGGKELAAALVHEHRGVPTQDEDYACDWGATQPFTLAGRGPGECGAGVFDLIELDLATATDALTDGRLFAATVHTARALLVTRGEEARDDAEVLSLFRRLFIDAGLVDASFRGLVDAAHDLVHDKEPELALASNEGTGPVADLVEAVRHLYASLDDSLRFPSGESGPTPTLTSGDPVPSNAESDAQLDLRGVVCPLNYVKTKLRLSQMAPGELLSLLLDEAGARNVPESTVKDGNEVLAVHPEDEHWRVLIRRA